MSPIPARPPSPPPAAHPRHVARRELLAALGAPAFVAPFLRARAARAAGPPPGAPQHLVVVTWPEGFEAWQPTGGETAFQFGDVLASLAPFRDRLLVVNGVKGGTSNIILQHSEGPYSLWTGAQPKGGLAGSSLSTRPSFDQMVVARWASPTPYKSLHFGVQTNRPSFISNAYVHYAGPQQPIPAEDDPAALYKLIFGGLTQDAASLDRLRAERRSVLDFLGGRLRALRTQVAAADRVKLDKHEEGLRAIERGLDGLGRRCAAPAQAPAMTKQAAMADANFAPTIKLQTELMVAALQCGATRVATLQLSNTDSQTKIPVLATSRGVHDAMHSGTTAERMEVYRFFGAQLGYVLDRLKAVDLGGGRSLLDETLVVMGSEMARGTHWNEPIPFILAGAGGGVLKMGRFVTVRNRPRHTKLIATVLHALGLPDVQAFGEFVGPDSQGDLPELRG
jgi:hypothetical protein